MGYEREPTARTQALALMTERESIEAEMSVIMESLNAPGQPGISGNLVDADGFPRADIDILNVRTRRHKLACLRTDLSVINGKIEKLLHEALKPPPDGDALEKEPEANGAGSSSVGTAGTTGSSSVAAGSHAGGEGAGNADNVQDRRTPVRVTRPSFAVVDEVTAGSPADSAGLIVGDTLISFGAVSLRSFTTPEAAMRALPGLLREHEGREIVVSVSRAIDVSQGPAAAAAAAAGEREMFELKLTPLRWSGNGLLGCHVVALPPPQDSFVPEVATMAAERRAQDVRPQ